MSKTFIADAHCDTLFKLAICGSEQEENAVTAKTLAEGGVGLQTFALFCGRSGPQGTPYEDGVRMIEAAKELGIPMLTGELPAEPPTEPAGVFSCEGGEMLEGSITRLEEFHRKVRLRIITLTWNYENEIGFPANDAANGGSGSGSTAYGGMRKGLKPFGFTLLRAMDQRGILADTSHLNEAGFWDVCEHAALPPIASHSNCRWLCDVPRNLSKEQVRALIERGGFIGINFYTQFLREEGPASIEDVVRHIDALCEMGAERIVGFGSDFDGIEEWPQDLEDPSQFPAVLEALRRRGYSEEQLRRIAGLNLWDLLKRAERGIYGIC